MTVVNTPPAARGRLTVRPASPFDEETVRALLVGLSERSLFQRFLTGMSTPPPTLVRYLTTVGGRGAALLAEVDGLVVGHGLWAPATLDAAESRAEIAIVVADGHQRRGIGTTLAQALMADLGRRGFQRAQVVTAADNRAVLRMVARQDPAARPERDGSLYSYDLPLDRPEGVAVEHRDDLARGVLPRDAYVVAEAAARQLDATRATGQLGRECRLHRPERARRDPRLRAEELSALPRVGCINRSTRPEQVGDDGTGAPQVLDRGAQ